MRHLALLLIAMGCEVAPPSAPPEDFSDCFSHPSPELWGPPKEHVGRHCFHMPHNKNGVVEDPWDPKVCSGVEIPGYEEDDFADAPLEDWEHIYSISKYLTTAELEERVETFVIADSNIMAFAETYLWPLTTDDEGSYLTRSVCGSEARCVGNELQDEVSCYISVTDCSLTELVLRTYHLVCSGVEACGFVGKEPEECCAIVEG